MAKYQQRTKVIVNGQDVSHLVQRVDIPREPGEANLATITFFTEPLQVDDEGKLIITIDTREQDVKTRPCTKCGHHENEHRDGACVLCGYLFASPGPHEYQPDEDA